MAVVIILGVASTLSYSPQVRNYTASVIHSVDQLGNATVEASFTTDNSLLNQNTKNPHLINFNIHEVDNRFVAPGAEKAEIMILKFKTEDSELLLQKLRLQIAAVDGDKIKRAYLFDGEEELSSTKVAGNYLNFGKLNYRLGEAQEGNLKIKLDLSEELKTGDRIRLDVEAPEDIDILVGGQDYKIDRYYPIEGKYLSVVKPRVWEKVNWKTPEF